MAQPGFFDGELLDLALLIDRKHDGIGGQDDVEPDGVTQLGSEDQPAGELKLRDPMGLQIAWPAPEKWLFAKFGGSGCEEEPSSEEIEIGAAVHGALQELETRDLPLGLPTAPRQCQRGPNGVSVLTDAGGKALHDADTAGFRFTEPYIERHDIRFSQRLRATTAPDNLGESPAVIHDRGCLGIEVFWLPQEIPG